MADNQQIAACGMLIATILSRRHRRVRNRTFWVRDWVSHSKRQEHGAYHELVNELLLGDQVTYRNFLRMDVTSFEELLSLVAPHITYSDTNMRPAIPPGEQLVLTLRFLASGQYLCIMCVYILLLLLGESYTSLQYLYRIPRQTIGKIVPETCSFICEVLKDYMKVRK